MAEILVGNRGMVNSKRSCSDGRCESVKGRVKGVGNKEASGRRRLQPPPIPVPASTSLSYFILRLSPSMAHHCFPGESFLICLNEVIIFNLRGHQIQHITTSAPRSNLPWWGYQRVSLQGMVKVHRFCILTVWAWSVCPPRLSVISTRR